MPYSFTSKRPSYLFTSSIDWKTIPCLRMRAYFLCLPFSAVRVCHIYLLHHGLCFYIPAGVLNGRSLWPSLERRRNASCSAKNEGLLISKIWVWYLKAWILLAMDFIESKDSWSNSEKKICKKHTSQWVTQNIKYEKNYLLRLFLSSKC